MPLSQKKISRPEYPRPQFVRSLWFNLNGEWEFDFDDADEGLTQDWHDGRELPLRIVVPFAYQTLLSGMNDKSVHEIVWYARSFDVQEEFHNRDLLLNFGAVDYAATVWVNGYEVGHNRGGHVPFQFDIAPYVNVGKNRLTVRVEDRQDPKQPRGKQSYTGLPESIDYYCTTGIWQTVWLEPVPPIRIEELRIITHAKRNLLELTVFLHAPSAVWRVEVEVLEQGRRVALGEDHTAVATGRLAITIPYAKLWSPESPHLYDLQVRLYDGENLLDEVASYVGLRGIELRERRFLLNGKPTYLKMILDQGYWPEGYLTAPSDEALQTDIGWVKMFGFNGVRKHQKIEDPRWLYWCDRLGVLVWEEMPNAREWSPKAEDLLSAEWQDAVRRDYNHPCIVAWVPVNESMGFPGLSQQHAGQYAFIERMVRVTRRLDSTRPVIDNDGWEHTDITDVCAIHDYTPTSEKLSTRYQDMLSGGNLPLNVWLSDKPLFARGSKYRGQPIILSEVGGFLAIPPEVSAEKRDMLYQFYDSFQTSDELLEKYRDLMEGIASLKFLAGFCYTQLTDIEQEINGLLTYHRQPKLPAEQIATIHREVFGE
ncbi:MAG TPA: glycoside hydrolase family 2 TIM barrel-domain containing protein [Pyrinomonadaceae bacterium]|jgi:beta-galactosidase/beta-glucuronidase|nr:glycoside hydrolase family 2 TIM barrel-domain containing protein [Pyrinomonadaceae bacterium]